MNKGLLAMRGRLERAYTDNDSLRVQEELQPISTQTR